MLLLSGAPELPPAQSPPAGESAIELEIVESGPVAAAAGESAQVPAARKPPVLPGPSRKVAPVAAPAETSALVAAPDRPVAGDEPTAAPNLHPSLTGELAASLRLEPSPPRGHTVLNDGFGPDPRALAEQRAEEAGRKVTAWAGTDLGMARVQSGQVPPYFHDLQKALEQKGKKVEPWIASDPRVPKAVQKLPGPLRDFVVTWSDGAQSYAKTGSPYAPGAQPEGSAGQDAVNPTELRAAAEPGSLAALGSKPFRDKAYAAARLREFADGRFGQGLTARVELRQDVSGSLKSLELVLPSGNPVFDRHVMKVAPEAVLSLPPLDGGFPEGAVASLWEFQGRVTYLRKVKPGEAPKELLTQAKHMAVMSLLNLGLGALGAGDLVPTGPLGYFDEVTGETLMVDFSQPNFTMKARLLGVY
ncbi:MAG: hypothetical protein ACYC8T_04165 [Myxococcaceae bacterium]